MKTLQLGCCKKKQCLAKFAEEDILELRKTFWKLGDDGQRQYLLTAFTLNTYHTPGKQRCYSFEYGGKSLCPTGWYRALGISNGWYVIICVARLLIVIAFLHTTKLFLNIFIKKRKRYNDQHLTARQMLQ